MKQQVNYPGIKKQSTGTYRLKRFISLLQLLSGKKLFTGKLILLMLILPLPKNGKASACLWVRAVV